MFTEEQMFKMEMAADIACAIIKAKPELTVFTKEAQDYVAQTAVNIAEKIALKTEL